MRGAHVQVCGCFPTGRHYPGIAARIAQAVATVVKGLVEELGAARGRTDVPVQIGLASWQPGNEPGDLFESYLACDRPVTWSARKVHGITDEELANAPRFDELYAEIAGLLAGRVPVAYNAGFDKKFLLAECRRCASIGLSMATPPAFREEVEWIAPLVWVRELQKYEKGKKLTDVCQRLEIPLEQAHRAAGDAEATGHVLMRLARDMPATYAELIRIQGQYAATQDAELVTWRSRRN